VPEKDQGGIGIHFGRSVATQLRLPPRHELLVVGKDEQAVKICRPGAAGTTSVAIL